MMAAFIDVSCDELVNISIHTERIETMCDIAEDIIAMIPFWLDFVATPFIDYTIGARCYVKTVNALIPEPDSSCAPYWTRPF